MNLKAQLFLAVIHILRLCSSSGLESFSECGKISENLETNGTIGKWPWMVSFGRDDIGNWTHLCGGSLLSKTHVLTAGHCMKVMETNQQIQWKARMGDSNLVETSDDTHVQVKRIVQFFSHPNYQKELYGGDNGYHDISVVVIEEVIFTEAVRPICIPDELNDDPDAHEGKDVILTGWGATSLEDYISDIPVASPVLKELELRVFNLSYCNSTSLNPNGTFKDGIIIHFLVHLYQPDLICAGPIKTDLGTCKGDSGGPLVYFNSSTQQYTLLGSASGGNDMSCGAKNFPDIFVRIDHSSNLNFIKFIIAEYFNVDNDPKFSIITFTDDDEDERRQKFIGQIKLGKKSFGTIRFQNNATYRGHLLDGKAHGQGVMYLANGGRYSGTFKEGLANGVGSVHLPNGKTIHGFFKDDRVHGFAKVVEADGDRYEGHYVNSRKEGKGTYWYSNGDIYTGGFLQSQRHGFGSMSYQNGKYYEGHFKNDDRNGAGVLTWPNGDKYEGEFMDDYITGEGTMTYHDGGVYTGHFSLNEKDGYGISVEADGKRYEGSWSRGVKSGNGSEWYPEQDWYVGEFLDGVRSGEGTYHYGSNGNVYVGNFSSGLMNGYGQLNESSGSFYEGTWLDGLKSGYGLERFPGNYTYSGKFDRGRFHGQGLIVYSDGISYSGGFKNGKADGYGIKTSCNGKIIHMGKWEKGKFVEGKDSHSTLEDLVTTNSTAATNSSVKE